MADAGSFRPPAGAYQQALSRRMPGAIGMSGGMSGGMSRPSRPRTPQGTPMGGSGGFMGGSGGFMGGMPPGAPTPNRAPSFTPGSNFGSMGTMGAGWHPGLMDGPSQHMFSALPQGLEEAMGFAPQGFSASLKAGGYKGNLPALGMF